jgi:hypothetical protein
MLPSRRSDGYELALCHVPVRVNRSVVRVLAILAP